MDAKLAVCAIGRSELQAAGRSTMPLMYSLKNLNKLHIETLALDDDGFGTHRVVWDEPRTKRSGTDFERDERAKTPHGTLLTALCSS